MDQNQLEKHFQKFKNGIVGNGNTCKTSYGQFPVVYADWIAEGRLYKPIEDALVDNFGPFVANPHSYSSFTGQRITASYKKAREIIKNHVNANESDLLITVGHGMTGAMERLIKILEAKFNLFNCEEKAVVFISHMEHHSNHTVWNHPNIELVVVPPGTNGNIDPSNLKESISHYKNRKIKIGSFTGCSNVTGIITPYHQLAEIMHDNAGICFVDFAASAPYVNMNMNPKDPKQKLDAILFAPHKFLGGPGTCGVLIINESLHSGKPSIAGGGNVKWTLPPFKYGVSLNLEIQEDSGTPAYMQTIKTALAIKLKEDMGVANINAREKHLLDMAIDRLKNNPEIDLLGCDSDHEKIGVLSFNIKGLHYNVVVRLLNDRFGIQTRGGWSCASTYSYYLFDFLRNDSESLANRIQDGNLTGKPGWVRLSLHPTISNEELEYCLKSIEEIASNKHWGDKYFYNSSDNEYYPNDVDTSEGLLTLKVYLIFNYGGT